MREAHLMNAPSVDLKDPDLYTSGTPHEVFARLRRECPVYWNPEADGAGFWAAILILICQPEFGGGATSSPWSIKSRRWVQLAKQM
jgi:hypothetical protein